MKLDNILLDEDGYIKLIDFGLAKKIEEQDLAYTKVGTPEYMAPELIAEQNYNTSADIWSFGILALEMANGETPYTGIEDPEEIL